MQLPHVSRKPVSPGRSACLLAALLLVLCGCEDDSANRHVVTGGDIESGRQMIEFYDCGSCHAIPGIREADGVVGPPLDFWSRRSFIAGAVPNQPDQLIRWLMDPQSVEPGTAMPDLGITEPEARDMAAYLYSLD